MPPFQSSVRLAQTTGIVGEIIFDGPQRARPVILRSTDPLNNVIGRAMYHLAGDDDAVSAEDADTLVFAGILANPKVYATDGPASGSLDPTLTLLNEENAEVIEMGIIIVQSLTAVTIGGLVFASDTTGELREGAAAGFTQVPNAKFVRNNTTGAGLAIVELTN